MSKENEFLNVIKTFTKNQESKLYFYGKDDLCKFMINFFKTQKLSLPIAICNYNLNDKSDTFEGLPIVTPEKVLAIKDVRIIITDISASDKIHKELLEVLKQEQVLKISHFFNINKQQSSTEKSDFDAKNKRYTDSLRGINNEKFDLPTPNDMPEKAKQIVSQINQLNTAYINGENFYIDSKKTLMLKDFCQKKLIDGVHRLDDYLSHLVERELGCKRNFPLVIEDAVENISQFSNYLKNKDIPFLYMQLPCKISPIKTDLPKGTTNLSNDKSTELVNGLKQKGVNTLDYRQVMIENNIDFLENFFKTDPHWKIILSFEATKRLCEEIEQLIDMQLDLSKLDINNYDRINYPNIILGSQGKSVGVSYAGVEDFEIILPKYDTEYTWSCINHGFTKHGNAKEALLYPIHLNWNYNFANPYAVYSLIDSGYTVIENHKANSKQKILCLNDSFSNPMASFIAPHFSQSHFLDLRGTKKDLNKIIEDINPDIVVMLYTTFSYNIYPIMTQVNPNINH